MKLNDARSRAAPVQEEAQGPFAQERQRLDPDRGAVHGAGHAEVEELSG
jgi:hypothetical protein